MKPGEVNPWLRNQRSQATHKLHWAEGGRLRTTCQVPSSEGVFSATITLPLLASDSLCSEMAGLVIYLDSGTPPGRSSFFRWLDLQATPACNENPDCLLTSSLDFALLSLVGTACKVRAFLPDFWGQCNEPG